MFSILAQMFRNILDRKVTFFAVLFVVLVVTYGFLVAVDFIPEAPSTDSSSVGTEDKNANDATAQTIAKTETVGTDRTPDKIIFDSLGGKQVTILNPSSTSVEVLDNALLSGAVRYPDSADLLSDGTMFLLGHSSYLPVVHNKNFQAFNGIQDLKWGDKIRVQSSDFEYVYRVDRVYEAKASEASVSIVKGRSMLALATCNSFGTKDDRFIVEATLVDSYPL